MPTFSKYHSYAVEDGRSQEAQRALADLPGEVGRLVRKLAAYNVGRTHEARTDALHILVVGPLITVPDLPCFGPAPAAWQEAYAPYHAAYSEIEACDAAFLALWRGACDKLLADAADDEEARRLVARIEAQRDAVTRPIEKLQQLRCALLPDALASWSQAVQADQDKLPALEKRAAEAARKAEEARNAVNAVSRHLDYARGQIQAIGKEMLGLVEHAEKHEALRKLLGIKPPAPVGTVLYPRPIAGHAAPLAAPEDVPGSATYTESPW